MRQLVTLISFIGLTLTSCADASDISYPLPITITADSAERLLVSQGFIDYGHRADKRLLRGKLNGDSAYVILYTDSLGLLTEYDVEWHSEDSLVSRKKFNSMLASIEKERGSSDSSHTKKKREAIYYWSYAWNADAKDKPWTQLRFGAHPIVKRYFVGMRVRRG